MAIWLFSAATATAHLPAGIDVSLTLPKSKVSVDEAIMVEVSYHNTSSETVRFLKWDTAMEGRVNADFLSVSHNGAELAYTGRVYKRASPSAADYVTLAPGQKVTAHVNLLTGYGLDLAGDYQISLRTGASLRLKVASVSVNLSSDRSVALKRTPIVNSCSSGRKDLINSALSAAESIARRARDDLRNTPIDNRSSARRYREWFGAYSEARWNKVQDHFNRIYSAASGRVLTFICDDTETAFAYVYPSRPYDIYLGGAFWRAPRTGTDSKAGTIIHELSHFTVLGGTDDHVYGQSGARNLANTDPSRAADNADSHEYFAENTPFLSMPGPLPPEPDPAPDLAISTVSAGSSNSYINDVISVSGVAKNSGNATSAATQLSFKLSSDARITLNDPEIKRLALGSLRASSVSTFGVDILAPDEAGQYWIGVCATPVGGELVTNNNCSTALPLQVERRAVITTILELLLLDEPSE